MPDNPIRISVMVDVDPQQAQAGATDASNAIASAIATGTATATRSIEQMSERLDATVQNFSRLFVAAAGNVSSVFGTLTSNLQRDIAAINAALATLNAAIPGVGGTGGAGGAGRGRGGGGGARGPGAGGGGGEGEGPQGINWLEFLRGQSEAARRDLGGSAYGVRGYVAGAIGGSLGEPTADQLLRLQKIQQDLLNRRAGSSAQITPGFNIEQFGLDLLKAKPEGPGAQLAIAQQAFENLPRQEQAGAVGIKVQKAIAGFENKLGAQLQKSLAQVDKAGEEVAAKPPADFLTKFRLGLLQAEGKSGLTGKITYAQSQLAAVQESYPGSKAALQVESILTRLTNQEAALKRGAGDTLAKGLSERTQAGLAAQVAAAANLKTTSLAQSSAEALIAKYGLTPTGAQQIKSGPGGLETTTTLTGPRGATAQYTKETGELNLKLGEHVNLLGRIKNAGVGTWNAVTEAAVRLSGVYYTFRNLDRLFHVALINPVENFVTHLVEATENARKFEIAISGVAGGLVRAGEINNELIRLSEKLPITLAEARNAALSLSLLPSLAYQTATGTPQEVASRSIKFGQLAARLGQIEPEQGTQGAVFAIRQLLQGDTTPLRRRFGLSVAALTGPSSLGGITPAELRTDPTKALGSLERLVDVIVPPETLNRTQQLVSFRIQKIRDAIEVAFSRIGEAGVFDKTVSRLEKLQGQLFAFFDSKKFAFEANRISYSLDSIVGSVGSALGKLLDAITGTPNDTSTIEGVANTTANVIDRIAELAKHLPEVVEKLKKPISDISDQLAKLTNAIIDIANVISEPDKYAAKVAAKYVVGGATRVAGAIETTLGAGGSAVAGVGAGAPNIGKALRIGAVGAAEAGAIETDRGSVGTGVAGNILAGTVKGPAALLGFFTKKRTPPPDLLGPQGPAGFVTAAKQVGVEADAYYESMRYAAEKAANDIKELPTPNFGALVQYLRAAEKGMAELVDDQKNQFKLLDDAAGSVLSAARHDTLASFLNKINIGGFLDPIAQALGSLKIGPEQTQTIFELLQQQRAEALQGLPETLNRNKQGASERTERIINAGPFSGLNLEVEAAQLEANLDGIKKYSGAIRDINEKYEIASSFIAKQLNEDARNFGQKTGELLARVPLASGFVDEAIRGTTDFGKQIRAVLEKAGKRVDDIGLLSFPTDKAIAIVQQTQQQRLIDLQAFTRTGYVAPGFDARLLRLSAQKPLTDRQANQEQVDYLRGSRQVQEDLLAKATGEAEKNPLSIEAKRNVADITRDLAVTNGLIQELTLNMNDLAKSTVQFGAAVRGAFENSLGKGIADAIKGTGSLKDVLLGFVDDVINSFSQFASHNITQALLGDFLQPQKSGLPGPLGGLLGGIPGLGSFFGGIGKAFGLAEGGVIPGPYIPFKAFSEGGIAHRPTLGFVAEAGRSEAVIPLTETKRVPVRLKGIDGPHVVLPGGRSIGIDIEGYADGGVMPGSFSPFAGLSIGDSVRPVPQSADSVATREHFIIVHSPEEAYQKGFRSAKGQTLTDSRIARSVAKDIMEGGQVGRAITRKHGKANQS